MRAAPETPMRSADRASRAHDPCVQNRGLTLLLASFRLHPQSAHRREREPRDLVRRKVTPRRTPGHITAQRRSVCRCLRGRASAPRRIDVDEFYSRARAMLNRSWSGARQHRVCMKISGAAAFVSMRIALSAAHCDTRAQSETTLARQIPSSKARCRADVMSSATAQNEQIYRLAAAILSVP